MSDAPVEILSMGEMTAEVDRDLLARGFRLHRSSETPVAELVAAHGPRIRAIATRGRERTPGTLIEQLPALEIIANYSVGYDSIDVATAARRGVVVTNTPDVLDDEVADYAVGLLLATITGSPRYFFETLMALFVSTLMVFLIGALAGFAARPFMPRTFNEAFAHSRLWWPELIVLAIGAVILTMSFVRSEAKPFLPSVIVAYGLFLPLSAGNVRIEHIGNAYRNSPLFRRLRDSSQLEGKCGDCNFRNLCGGSRSRSYALTGNYMASDPRCVYQPGS